ncbi:DUF6701 domain-containing protein [Vibrio alfacsensis]|uniref:DUF6701 domain-containing protein n=1 Tax=Vibrio alfacsensis TaxID=1074311 RepID=UPI004069240F
MVFLDIVSFMKIEPYLLIVLMVSPLYSSAADYVLSNLTHGSSVSFCPNGTISVIDRSSDSSFEHAIEYHCSTDIVLQDGDNIQNVGSETVLLSANKSIRLNGGHAIGYSGGPSYYSPIFLRAITGSVEYIDLNSGSPSHIHGDIIAKQDIRLRSSSIYGSTYSESGKIVLTGSNNGVFGEVIANSNITINDAINIEGDVKSTGGFVTLSEKAHVTGDVIANQYVELDNSFVDGSVISEGQFVRVLGEKSEITGQVKANQQVTLHNTVIGGSVTSTGMYVEVTGSGNVINGDVLATQRVKLIGAQVCGDVTSSGEFIETGSSSVVVGDLKANQNITLGQYTSIYGNLTSSGNKVSLTESSIYSDISSIIAHESNTVVSGSSNNAVCGRIKARSFSGLTHYCGKSEPGCNYAAYNCPGGGYSAPPQCKSTPPPPEESNDLSILVTPKDDMALMCGEDLPQFTILTTDNGDPTSTNILTELSNPGLFSLEVVVGQEVEANKLFTSNVNGELVLRVVPNDINNTNFEADTSYFATFTLSENTAQSQAVRFMFTPFLLDVRDPISGQDNIGVVAGKAKAVSAKLLACTTSGEPVIASNFSGAPSVSHHIVHPLSGMNGDLTFNPHFERGVTDALLTINESGLFSVELHDSFQCEGFSECPENGVARVSGKVDIRARPWTVAICENSISLANGDALQGSGFIAAGEEFSLKVKPIVWQSGGALDGPINTESYCNNARVTSNFMRSDGPSAQITLTSEQHTPIETRSQMATLLASNQPLSKAHDAEANEGYIFSNLYWNEVGSLTIKANLANTYLGMEVNQGERTVGRFYPKYFKAINSQWVYPLDQDFVYMGQPFNEISYDVVALNAKKENVRNYVHFSPELRQHFHLGELSSYSERFVPPASSNTDWNLLNGASVGTFKVIKASLNANCINSPCWEKGTEEKGDYPDGPFNHNESALYSQIGLVAMPSEVIDEVNFFDNTHILETQPDIRFGRINIKDVGGNQGTSIRLPMSTEIWFNHRFVTHFSDSSTRVDGEHYDVTPIWSSSYPDNAKLTGAATFFAGKSMQILASQNTSAREQVKFIINLDQVGNALPWLKYNWERSTTAEENPSAVVTFGIHRGNDRIIYRGEPNFIGMN